MPVARRIGGHLRNSAAKKVLNSAGVVIFGYEPKIDRKSVV